MPAQTVSGGMAYLADQLARVSDYRYDLVGFAREAIPFGQPGPWERWKDLWPWQLELLESIGAEMREKRWGEPGPDGEVQPQTPIQRCICSCTGSGKTSLVLPLVLLHALAVHPTMRAVCISPSREQIKDKLANAVKVMIESSPWLSALFTFAESGKVARRRDPGVCFAVFRTAAEREALQGTHGVAGMIAVFIDEASGVPDELWQATAGARQDPQALVIIAGNPLRGDGFYHDRHTGRLAEKWKPVVVPADTLPTWVEARREDLIADHGGEDTETYRASVLALPPLEGSNAFINRKLIETAMNRPLVDDGGRPVVPHDTPLVAGVDLGREGEAKNCVVFRAGMDARSVPIEELRGRDITPAEKVAWLVRIATEERPPYGVPAVIYVDATGLDGQLRWDIERTNHYRKFVWVSFADPDKNRGALNKRALMWQGLRSWLHKGGRLRSSPGLLRWLNAARAEFVRDRMAIIAKDEMKKLAGGDHADEGDALLLAMLAPPVGPPQAQFEPDRRRPGAQPLSWMA